MKNLAIFQKNIFHLAIKRFYLMEKLQLLNQQLVIKMAINLDQMRKSFGYLVACTVGWTML